ncbi:MAG: ABC transporter ATP-binding protein/permease [bacterium]
MANKESAMLKLVDIKKHYTVAGQDIEALKGINLDFKAGEFVSILGPSGCGKTTMLNLIGGLDKYSSGDLVINGTSTKKFKDSDWDAYRNNSIGFVFQSYNLIPHLTILGNVELALTLSGVSKSDRTQRAKEVLTKVGLEDHITKKPNQLSGGQMQRVAIARALINNPDIILADEPTGALDTDTSVQIMELLKEVAKDKLVIMVTHNPELAVEYSSRIVKFKDGVVLEDTNPFIEKDAEDSSFMPKKTSMPFSMALSLSFKNLISKKARTIITAVAGSIGIIGIAMVLALSTGFQGYVDDMQSQLTTEYPLELSKYSMNMDVIMDSMNSNTGDKFPNDQFVGSDTSVSMDNIDMYINNFSEYFVTHMENTDPELYNEILISYALNLNVYVNNGANYKKVKTKADTNSNALFEMMMPSSAPWGQLLSNEDFLLQQFELLDGKLPTTKNEVVLFVDEYNKISSETLVDLGFGSKSSISFDDIIGHSFKLFTNDLMYQKTNNIYSELGSTISNTVYETGMDIEIVGIMRVSESASVSSIDCTIGYTKDLVDYLIGYETNELTKSGIVDFVSSTGGVIDPFTGGYVEGIKSIEVIGGNFEIVYEEGYDYTNVSFYSPASFGASNEPTDFDIYPVTLEAKEQIKAYIQEYNDSLTDEEVENGYTIKYLDTVEMMVGSLNTMIAAISAVLIAFTSISLIVSSVMIGIITYVSVIERTKEIGVLRSIGARKKDISRVFNAETLIIGFCAGFFAISFTYLISIPINIVVGNALDISNICSLSPIAAIILILISMFLTYTAGLIPSRGASKKDPVTALRSE